MAKTKHAFLLMLCAHSLSLQGCGERTIGPASTAAAFTITIDVSEVPEMKPWSDQLQQVLDEWYPKLVRMLPSDGFTAPHSVLVTIKKDIGEMARKAHAVAYASGTSVVADSDWFKKHPDDQGAIVHELVHVVQNYHGTDNPSWLVEGVADYIRWFSYEPLSKRPRPDPRRAKYTDGYQITGAFLDYIVRTRDPKFVENINADMRKSGYSSDLWKKYAGGTVDELWSEYIATLEAAKPN